MTRTTKTKELESLIILINRIHRDLITQGKLIGSLSSNGGSYWGILRLLVENGSMTVPEIARRRNLSRQRVQVLVDQFVAGGALEFLENSEHKRSKLVAITQKGKEDFKKLSQDITARLDAISKQFKLEEIQSATAVLTSIDNKLEEENGKWGR